MKDNLQISALGGKVFLKKIPPQSYKKILQYFSRNYHYRFRISNKSEGGANRRVCPYFLAIHKSLALDYLSAIDKVLGVAQKEKIKNNPSVSEGFRLLNENSVTSWEKKGDFTFAYLDVAITDQGFKFIEFQAFPTYPFTFSKLEELIIQGLSKNFFLDPDCEEQSSTKIQKIMKEILQTDSNKTVAIVDLNPRKLPYRVESFAAIKEIGQRIYLVDVRDIFEKNGSLYFIQDGKNIKINVFYNRLVPDDAKRILNYPYSGELKFRYDKNYRDLIFINHPYNFFRFSKELLPKVKHPFVPKTFPLSSVAKNFLSGKFSYHDYVWKRIEGYGGIGNILYPSERDLIKLQQEKKLKEYVCQERVKYLKFRGEDGKERMVMELRFIMMFNGRERKYCGASWAELKEINKQGKIVYRGSQYPGYGLMPVLFFN